MKNYELQTDHRGNKVVSYESNGIRYSFPEDESNSDYQAYLRWLENPDADEAQSLLGGN